MGNTPAQQAVRYRGYAAQCLILAQHQDGAADKAALVAMAQAWIALAEQDPKNEAQLVVYETPAKPAE